MHIDQMTVLDLEGATKTLGSIRQGRPGVIILVRHFGCIFCRQRIAELVDEVGKHRKADVVTLVIGNGTARMAADFVQHHNINVPVFTDPSRKVYQQLGMNRRFGLNLKTLSQSITAFRQGHRQAKVQGDVWQQGGVVTFGSDGMVRFQAADREAGSDIPWEDVWRSLQMTPSAPMTVDG